MTEVAIYARSRTAAASDRSVSDQVERCRSHAAWKGWSVAEVFVDPAQSGSARERPGLDALLGRAHEFTAILTETVDRIGRDPAIVESSIERLASAGCALETLSDGHVGSATGAFAGAVR